MNVPVTPETRESAPSPTNDGELPGASGPNLKGGEARSTEPRSTEPRSTEPTPPEAGCSLGPFGRAVYNALYWPYLLGSCVFLFFPALALWLLTAAWDKKRRVLGGFTRWWGRHYLAWAPLAGLRVDSTEPIARLPQAIYVSNHLSMVDILALYAIPRPFLWVSKIENFYVPFLGWNMWLNRYVPLRRGHLPSIVRMYRLCLRRLREGASLCLFPEGTRSDTGQMRPFYSGAFRLALRAGVPIVPVVLEGSDRVLPKRRFSIAPQLVTLRVLAPVHPLEVDHDWRRLRDEVRRRMEEAQAALRPAPPPRGETAAPECTERA